MTADYSQIELRVLAHFSGDATLRQAFADDRDIHAQVASEVYGVPLDQVTSEMRRSAKAVNFGVIYGQSPFGLAKALGIEQQRSGRVHRPLFRRLSGRRCVPAADARAVPAATATSARSPAAAGRSAACAIRPRWPTSGSETCPSGSRSTR